MQVHYRQLTIEDRPRLLGLFERVPPTIARMSNKLVYRAIVDDALRSRHVVMFVASLDGNLVGYVIAAWNWNYFKRMFVLRHPLVGLAAAAKRLREKLERHDASAHDPSVLRRDFCAPCADVATSCCVAGSASNRRGDAVTLQAAANSNRIHAWEDSARTIAKVIYLGIDPQVRSMGLGRGLYAHLITHFKQHGFTRVDSHIDKDNLASMYMLKKAGCTVIEDGCGCFAFFEIRPEGSDSNE